MKLLRWALLLLMPLVAGAQTTVFEEEARTPDLRVLIDVSGSMKQNDPKNLRKPALELLVQLFPEQARAGVWTFGQWVNMLVKHREVDPAWRAEALAAADKINSVALFTNIPEALERALDDLDRLDPQYRTSVILLTDGMVDISKDPAENQIARDKLLNTLLPRLRDAGVIVHSVALSNNADSGLLERLALDTGGLFAVAETADDLSRIFLRAFDAAAPAEQVPLEGDRFLIDSSVDEFTLLVFREDTAESVLQGPDGKRYRHDALDANTAWFRGQSYDLITVREPFEGEWIIQSAFQPGSRVTVVSNLSLAVKRLPQNLFAGNSPAMSVALTEQGKAITDPEFLRLMNVELEVQRRDDGQVWRDSLSAVEPAPADGLWESNLVMLGNAGIYELRVIADGKTFQRQQTQTVTVRERFQVLVDDTEAPDRYGVTLQVNNPELDPLASNVVATVTGPDGAARVYPLSGDLDRRWQLVVEEGLDAPGEYQVVFVVEGIYRGGDRFDHRTEPVTLSHRMTELAPAPLPEMAPEPVPEPEPVAPPPEPEPVPEPEGAPVDWQQYALYGGLALGNLFIIGLGFFAYRMVMGSGKPAVLDEDDDEADDGADSPAPVPDIAAELADMEAPKQSADTLDLEDVAVTEIEVTKPDPSLLDISDLPDDAIDIDPDADDRKA